MNGQSDFPGGGFQQARDLQFLAKHVDDLKDHTVTDPLAFGDAWVVLKVGASDNGRPRPVVVSFCTDDAGAAKVLEALSALKGF